MADSIETDSSHLMSTYAPLPVNFVRGEGVFLFDDQGRRFLDALGGIAVCALGHAHPKVTEALCAQAGRLWHTSNLYPIGAQTRLADRLAELSGMDKVFFSNSGAEANEAAIKLARLYGHGKGVDKPTIVVTEGSFHGRTLATLSATGNRKVQAGFEPLVSGFTRVPFGDLSAVETVAANDSNAVAVLVEPITGEGGVVLPPDGYLAGLRHLCDAHGWLLMFDEIQTGVGRTGRWFAHQHEGVVPDVMTLAKALGNGMPIGACLARADAAKVLTPGTHGSTFGGNPLACATSMSVLEVIEDEGLVERAGRLGMRFLEGFQRRLADHPEVVSIRGRGLMLGIELDRPCAALVNMALEQGLLINVTAERVLRLLPPYILTEEQVDELVERLSALIVEFVSAPD